MNRLLIAKLIVLIGLIGITFAVYRLAGWEWALLVGSTSAALFGLFGIDVAPSDDRSRS